MKLCIVTDIHSQPTQFNCLSKHLHLVSDTTRFALNELSEEPSLSGEALHYHLFAQGGMEQAVHNLKMKWEEGSWGLGYSAGGTALWRTAASGHDFAGIFCISSTRLRNEEAIDTSNQVFFGKQDQNIPTAGWLSTIPKQYTLLENAGHTYYLDAESHAAALTCQTILRDMSNPSPVII